MSDSKINFPDYVTTSKDKIIHRFLSNLADHHGKNVFWIRSQFGPYQRKFYNIPRDFLKLAFLEYLTDVMPSWLPTLPQVAEVLYKREDFLGHWHTIDLSAYYCRNCRTDPDGKEGGYRRIYYYGFIPSRNKIGEYQCVANCDCELGSKVTRSPLHSTLEWLRNHDDDAEIHVGYWCENQNRKIDPKELASITFLNRIEWGILRYGDPDQLEDPNEVYPCWDHPTWTGVCGEWQCERYGVEMPPEIREQYNMRPRLDKKKKFEDAVKLRRRIEKDPNAPLSAPKSLADCMRGNKPIFHIPD